MISIGKNFKSTWNHIFKSFEDIWFKGKGLIQFKSRKI